MPRWFRYCVGSLICIAAVLLFLVAAGGANSVCLLYTSDAADEL